MTSKLFPFCTIAAYTANPVNFETEHHSKAIAGCLIHYVPDEFPTKAIHDQLQSIIDSDDSETDEIDEIIEELNGLLELPAYCSIQFHEGDLLCVPNVESAIEDIETKVNDSGELPDGFTGEYLIISDHGNVTLMVSDGKQSIEIWGVV